MLNREELKSLLEGALSAEEKLAYLGRLAAEDTRNQQTFHDVTRAVAECLAPEARGLFGAGETANSYVDCCGTGGSGISHFNTSTTVAFVLAAAGLKTVKFGNRAASGRSGSFDLLDHLGIGAALPLPALPQILADCDLTFLFAPQFYPALAALAPLRKTLARPTVLNYIGPLLNPAQPSYRLIGVPRRDAQILVAMALQTNPLLKRALVVNAHSGLDELDGQCASTTIRIAAGREVQYEVLEAQADCGSAGKLEAALTVEDNARIFEQLLSGELGRDNYYHALVTLNAGAALHTAGHSESIQAGKEAAARLLADGSVQAKFKQYRELHAKYQKFERSTPCPQN
ncbi:MAG: anthranilate phosphoribosyltransferase [Cyanobacteria bacterium SZAS LIN-2]|nr:anthranilate phosphoribosyltransferase [Cyanobacteria bacterium SZAS LIN-3]MBS1998233.1 anthranilate phosphoribosyltransferase [Cyanobacteria bacterium SZAS LIN-2]